MSQRILRTVRKIALVCLAMGILNCLVGGFLLADALITGSADSARHGGIVEATALLLLLTGNWLNHLWRMHRITSKEPPLDANH